MRPRVGPSTRRPNNRPDACREASEMYERNQGGGEPR
jgi:hypothetical protein